MLSSRCCWGYARVGPPGATAQAMSGRIVLFIRVRAPMASETGLRPPLRLHLPRQPLPHPLDGTLGVILAARDNCSKPYAFF